MQALLYPVSAVVVAALACAIHPAGPLPAVPISRLSAVVYGDSSTLFSAVLLMLTAVWAALTVKGSCFSPKLVSTNLAASSSHTWSC